MPVTDLEFVTGAASHFFMIDYSTEGDPNVDTTNGTGNGGFNLSGLIGSLGSAADSAATVYGKLTTPNAIDLSKQNAANQANQAKLNASLQRSTITAYLPVIGLVLVGILVIGLLFIRRK